MSRSGDVTPRARTWDVSRPTGSGISVVVGGIQPMPIQKTPSPAPADATRSTASLSLIERSGSSGRGSRSRKFFMRPASFSCGLQGIPDAVDGPDQVGSELAAQRLDVA